MHLQYDGILASRERTTHSRNTHLHGSAIRFKSVCVQKHARKRSRFKIECARAQELREWAQCQVRRQ